MNTMTKMTLKTLEGDNGLSLPPVPSSPRPSLTNKPRRRSRATSASAFICTTAARSFASWPSGRSGCSLNKVVVTTRLSTESA